MSFFKDAFFINIDFVLLRTLTGHGKAVSSVAFDSNEMIASGSSDKTIKLWNKGNIFIKKDYLYFL
jgi:WD40 repeat protein